MSDLLLNVSKWVVDKWIMDDTVQDLCDTI